jgi:hypothetical protein
MDVEKEIEQIKERLIALEARKNDPIWSNCKRCGSPAGRKCIRMSGSYMELDEPHASRGK